MKLRTALKIVANDIAGQGARYRASTFRKAWMTHYRMACRIATGRLQGGRLTAEAMA